MGSWRAGCGESRTSGSEGGPGKRTGRKAGTAPRPDPYYPAKVLRQRPRMGQAPAGQGRDWLQGSRQRAAQCRGPRGGPSHLCSSRGRPPACALGPHDGRRSRSSLRPRSLGRVRMVLLHRQLEVSDTAVFDQPRRARAWFEAAIGDHLDLGRPERVSLLVDRTVVNGAGSRPPGASPPRSSPATPPPSSRSTTSPRRPRPI